MPIRFVNLLCCFVITLIPSVRASSVTGATPVAQSSGGEQLVQILDSMPDYLQTDTIFGGFPGKGRQYCAPVSVSNSLIWFAQNGWPQLFSLSGNRQQDQHALAHQLGSKSYMDTRPESGTAANQVCQGVERFLKTKGIPFMRLAYQGFRPAEKRFRDGRQPKIEDLVKSLGPNRAVWLNIGWYGYDKERNEYHRDGGHWVTLVGRGFDGLKANPNALVIHDPASPLKTEYIRMEQISSGKLTGDYPGLPQKAEGFMRTGGYAPRGIIDGAVILELSPVPVS